MATAEPRRSRAAYAREAVGWTAAVLVAGLLLTSGAARVFSGAHTLFSGPGLWSDSEDEWGVGPLERAGRSICGERLDWLTTFWLRHGDTAQLTAGVLAVLAAVVVFVAATFGWRRVAATALLLGIVALVAVWGAGRHADAGFWHGPEPGEDSWSSPCVGHSDLRP